MLEVEVVMEVVLEVVVADTEAAVHHCYLCSPELHCRG